MGASLSAKQETYLGELLMGIMGDPRAITIPMLHFYMLLGCLTSCLTIPKLGLFSRDCGDHSLVHILRSYSEYRAPILETVKNQDDTCLILFHGGRRQLYVHPIEASQPLYFDTGL